MVRVTLNNQRQSIDSTKQQQASRIQELEREVTATGQRAGDEELTKKVEEQKAKIQHLELGTAKV